MSAHLTHAQARELGQILQQQRADLTEAIERHLVAHEQTRFTDLIGQVGDLEDRALAELLVDDELAEIQREIAELRAVQAAEGRLSAGHCGTCSECGQAIAFERLKAWPTAQRCAPCQREYEATHGQPGAPTL